VLRVISEFESVLNPELNTKDSLEHPESSAAEQNKFLKHLKAMCDLANEGTVVNPFRETGPELITLDTEFKDCAYIDYLLNNMCLLIGIEFALDAHHKAVNYWYVIIQGVNINVCKI